MLERLIVEDVDVDEKPIRPIPIVLSVQQDRTRTPMEPVNHVQQEHSHPHQAHVNVFAVVQERKSTLHKLDVNFVLQEPTLQVKDLVNYVLLAKSLPRMERNCVAHVGVERKL